MRWIVCGLCCAVLGASAAGGNEPPQEWLDNWPHWRGPLANGSAPHGDPPVTWDNKTNVKWKTALPGRGSATPIIWGDRIFVLTAVDTGKVAAPDALPKQDPRFEIKTKAPTTYHQFLVLCLDRTTGRERWRQVAAERVPSEGHHPTHSYAAGSPATDGRYLYVSFGSFGVYCYDLDGKRQWQRDLGTMHTRYAWGEASTPAVHGKTVIVNWDHEGQSAIYALDARTGATLWKKDRDEPTTWTTPLIVEHEGQAQVIVSATKRVRSYDLATGELLWQCGGQTINVIPSPVVYRGLAICASGYQGSLACAVPLSARGDVTGTAKIAWRHTSGTPYVPSPLLVDDKLYFTQGNNALLTCLDAKTGKVFLNRERLAALSSLYGSPVAAKGRIYLTGRDGTTMVVTHSDKLEVLAVNKLDEPMDASPVVVGRQLLLRGERYLYCLEGN